MKILIGLLVGILGFVDADWQGTYKDSKSGFGQIHTLHLNHNNFEYVSGYYGDCGGSEHILSGTYQVKPDSIILYGIEMEERTDDYTANIHKSKKKVYHKTIGLKIIDNQTLGLGEIRLVKSEK